MWRWQFFGDAVIDYTPAAAATIAPASGPAADSVGPFGLRLMAGQHLRGRCQL